MVEFFMFIILFSVVQVGECSLTKFLHFWLKLGRTCLSVARHVETISIYQNMDLQPNRWPRSSHVRTIFVQIDNVWKDYNCLFSLFLTSYEGQRAVDTLKNNPLEILRVYMLRVISAHGVIL